MIMVDNKDILYISYCKLFYCGGGVDKEKQVDKVQYLIKWPSCNQTYLVSRSEEGG